MSADWGRTYSILVAVGVGVEEVLELALVVEVEFEQPAVTEGVVVEEFGRVEDRRR